jgi:hypothetical protein
MINSATTGRRAPAAGNPGTPHRPANAADHLTCETAIMNAADTIAEQSQAGSIVTPMADHRNAAVPTSHGR